MISKISLFLKTRPRTRQECKTPTAEVIIGTKYLNLNSFLQLFKYCTFQKPEKFYFEEMTPSQNTLA